MTAAPAHRIAATPLSLTDGFTAMAALCATGDVYPAESWDTARRLLAELGSAAARAGVQTMQQLVGTTAVGVIEKVSGVSARSAARNEDALVRFDTARNLLVAVHAAADLAHRVKLRAAGVDVDGQTCELPPADLPPTGNPRSGQRQVAPRPSRDDEIALQRIHYLAATGGKSLRAGNAYALAESGVLPGDTSSIGVEHLDDPISPSLVTVPARGTRRERTIRLTPFAARLLGRNLALMKDEGQLLNRLVFTGGTTSGATASASVSGMLARHATWAGLDDAAINPSSIPAHRYRQTLLAEGENASVRLAFGDVRDLAGDQLYRRRKRLAELAAVSPQDVFAMAGA